MKGRDASFEETGAAAGLTRLERRRLESSLEIGESAVERIAYQHTVFCQTCLPYRDPGEVRIWERKQGAVFLSLEAGRIRKSGDVRYTDVGLPFGSRPRLILTHLNREALLKGSARIEVEASLTAFIKRVLSNRSINSREIGRFKEQLTRFSTSLVRMSVDLPDLKAYQINTHIIDAIELWLTKDERQRVLWRLSSNSRPGILSPSAVTRCHLKAGDRGALQLAYGLRRLCLAWPAPLSGHKTPVY